MDRKYDAVWGGDPGAMGIFRLSDNKLMVSSWELRKYHNTTAWAVCRYCDQKALARIVRANEERLRNDV